ncbi:MAG TPA: hypothetical protein PLK30_15015 [Blastocatellia bacterium]|nr:hypothetical protein [Blastocatellia bacterium]
MSQDKYIQGHDPIGRRINVKKELAKYRSDPLYAFIDKLEGYHKLKIIEDDVSMYQLSYSWYYRSLERFLPEMSIAVRWFKGPYWALKEGRRYTDSERKIAEKYNAVSKYLYLDYYNYILYARIVLDRVAALARTFIKESNKPSFTSFNDHKKFFKKLTADYGENEEYARYIREKTDWFEMPLKQVRDQFIVHAAPRHLRIFGYPGGDNELALIINLPFEPTSPAPLAQVKTITVSIPRLAEQIHEFLLWFNSYALKKAAARQ